MDGVKRSTALAFAGFLTTATAVDALEVNVSFTNNAPANGTYLTPAWVGFHDGTFDVFNVGPLGFSLPSLESLAEDGNTAPISAAFNGSTSGIDTTVGGAPLAPGQTVNSTLMVAEDGSHNYFSFASMLLPSSDFFIGNDNPLTTSIAGLVDGTFSSITVSIVAVYDAGTEINDFATSAGNGLFGLAGGQGGANEGADENGFVALVTSAAYAGFLNGGGDLSGLDFSSYDSIASFTLSAAPSAVPVPAALPLLLSALGGLGLVRRRRVA